MTRIAMDGTEVCHVAYEICKDGAWYTVISYDNYHGYNYGHRHHPNGNRTNVRVRSFPENSDLGSFAEWARKHLLDYYWQERRRYEHEWELHHSKVQHRGGR